MEISQKLKPGSYMRTQSVIDFLKNKAHKWTLASVVDKVCPKHRGEHGTYFSTADLKNVIMPNIYIIMECDLVTYMILEDASAIAVNN